MPVTQKIAEQIARQVTYTFVRNDLISAQRHVNANKKTSIAEAFVDKKGCILQCNESFDNLFPDFGHSKDNIRDLFGVSEHLSQAIDEAFRR